MTPKEVIQLIKKNPLEQILHLNGSNRHYENRQWAWNMIFTAHRAISRKDCIRIVQQDWTPNPLASDRVATIKQIGPAPVLKRSDVPNILVVIIPKKTASGQKEG